MNTVASPKTYQNLSSIEFQKKLQDDAQAILLDVRTPEEFESERIPGSVNLNIMDGAFAKKVSALDKSKNYFIYCRSGARSAMTCTMMTNEGYTVYNLVGGIGAWQGEIC